MTGRERAAGHHATREAARQAEVARRAGSGDAAGRAAASGGGETAAAPAWPNRKWSSLIAGAAVAVGVVAAGLVGFGGGGGQDDLSQRDIQERRASFETFVRDIGPMALDIVPDEEVDEAIAGMDLAAAEKEQLRERVQQGQTRLAYVTVWDTHAEDGDVVTLRSDGVAIDVTARNSLTTVALPMPSSGVVNVTGKADGGGGITVAVRSGDIEVAIPWMQPTQGFGLPVQPGP